MKKITFKAILLLIAISSAVTACSKKETVLPVKDWQLEDNGLRTDTPYDRIDTPYRRPVFIVNEPEAFRK